MLFRDVFFIEVFIEDFEVTDDLAADAAADDEPLDGVGLLSLGVLFVVLFVDFLVTKISRLSDEATI